MSKRKRRNFSPQLPTQDQRIIVTREQLAEAVSLGIEQAEARRKAAEKKEKEEAVERWYAQLKCPKNYDRLKGWKRHLADWRILGAAVCLSFHSRKAEEGTLILHNLITILLSGIFEIVGWIFLCISIGCFVYQPAAYICGKWAPLEWRNVFLLFAVGCSSFGISRLFKLISDEISATEDTGFLIAMMSMLLALASLLISIAK